MKRKTAIFVGILSLAGLAFQPGVVLADTQDLLEHLHRKEQRDAPLPDAARGDERPGARHGRHGIDSGEAARRAQMRNGGGRVLGVDPTDDGYRVKLLKQGEVRTLLVPDGP